MPFSITSQSIARRVEVNAAIIASVKEFAIDIILCKVLLQIFIMLAAIALIIELAVAGTIMLIVVIAKSHLSR